MVFYSHGCNLGLNDRYGHSEGDALIDKMSGILHEFMHGGCRVYRVGGE